MLLPMPLQYGTVDYLHGQNQTIPACKEKKAKPFTCALKTDEHIHGVIAT